ncbi:response regulator [Pantanalinema rosaneae CENA516]|uniref:response regulator n=1 Tax=Pantanalinema rosaneae TaxID=1620701 RepID=UPI003D6FE23C
MSPLQVLIVDNHALVRAGFRSLLQSVSTIEVIAEAGDGQEALRLVEQYRPNLVLMDIAMPLMNGLEATAQITKEFPQVRVIILSMYANQEYIHQALRAGASGYVLKDSGMSELELAIQTIARGETYLSPSISKYVLADYVRRSGEANPLEQLTPRQREILQLIAAGKSTKEIAEELFISTKTVETHRVQLMERLNIRDIAGLVRYAIRKGLVVLDE